MEYRIFPIPLVEFQSCRGLDFFRDLSGEESTSILYTWLIQGEKATVLVDPCVNAEDIPRYSSGGFSGKRISSFREGLSRFGLKATDIEVVILTHLHYDHFVNAMECKNARVIIQKRELDFALNPHPLFASSYRKEWYKGVHFQAIEGDQEIVPGIQVLLTPGHTAGNQSVVIQTARGKAVIAGFCSTFEHFFPERFAKTGSRTPLPVSIPGICFNPMEAYDSALRVKTAGDILIPIHDLSFRDGKPIP